MISATRWIGLAVVAGALRAQAADPWLHVTKETLPLLPSNEIQLIKTGVDKDAVWIGTPNGAATIEGGVLRLFKPTKDLSVWDVTKRPEGGFWVGHSKGILLVDGDRTVQALEGLNVPAISMVGTQALAIAKNESTDRNALMQSDGESWSRVASFEGRNVLDIVRDAKGTFWLILDGDGVMEIDPKQGLKDVPHYLSRLNVTSVMTDSKGDTWCGMMSGGVMVRRGKEWKRVFDSESSAVLTLIEAGDGKVWAATSGNGVWVFDGTLWKGMLQEEGSVNLLKMTSDKRIWLSTQRRGGLRYWNGTEWKESLVDSLPLHSLLELPNGVLLAGSVQEGLYILGDYSIKGESSDGKSED